jgi:hypothetical protein
MRNPEETINDLLTARIEILQLKAYLYDVFTAERLAELKKGEKKS